MFGPDYTAGCPACSAIADGFDGSVVHLANHDVTLLRSRVRRSRSCRRTSADGLDFPWASSFGSDFNYDFQASHTEEQQQSGVVEYNFRSRTSAVAGGRRGGAARSDRGQRRNGLATYTREGPGMSAFALEDGVVYHTYSAYARGVDGLWGMYQWLDRAPKGRNETSASQTGLWFRRHDEYE